MKTSNSSGQKLGLADQLFGKAGKSDPAADSKQGTKRSAKDEALSFENELRSLIARTESAKSRQASTNAPAPRPQRRPESDARDLVRRMPSRVPAHAAPASPSPTPQTVVSRRSDAQASQNSAPSVSRKEAAPKNKVVPNAHKQGAAAAPSNDNSQKNSTSPEKKTHPTQSAAKARTEKQTPRESGEQEVAAPTASGPARNMRRRKNIEEELPEIADIRAVLGQGAEVSEKIPALAILSGRLDQVVPEKIPAIVSDSAFINVAMSLPEPTPTLKAPVALGVLLKDLGADQSILNELGAQGVDLNLEVAPADLFRGLGLDAQRVATELKLLKANVQMDEGLSPYIQRALKMHKRVDKKAEKNSLTEASPTQRPEAIADHLRNQEQMKASVPNQEAPVVMPPVNAPTPTGQVSSRSQDGEAQIAISTAEGAVITDQFQGDDVKSHQKPTGAPLVAANVHGPVSQLSPKSDVDMARALFQEESVEPSQSVQAQTTDLMSNTAFELVQSDPYETTALKMKGLKDVVVGELPDVSDEVDLAPEPVVHFEASAPETGASSLSRAQQLVVDQAQRDWFGGLVAEPKSDQPKPLPEIPVNSETSVFAASSNQVAERLQSTQIGAQLPKVDMAKQQDSSVTDKSSVTNVPSRIELSQRGDQQAKGDQQQSHQQNGSNQSESISNSLTGPKASMSSSSDAKFEVDQPLLPTSKLTAPIVRRAEMMVKEGGGAVRLELNTEEHGKIELAMRIENDRLELRIIAGTDAARQALTDQLPRLKESLDQQNLDLADVQVGVGSEQLQQGFAREGNQGREAQEELGRQLGRNDSGNVTSASQVATNLRKSSLGSSHNGKIQVSV